MIIIPGCDKCSEFYVCKHAVEGTPCMYGPKIRRIWEATGDIFPDIYECNLVDESIWVHDMKVILSGRKVRDDSSGRL